MFEHIYDFKFVFECAPRVLGISLCERAKVGCHCCSIVVVVVVVVVVVAKDHTLRAQRRCAHLLSTSAYGACFIIMTRVTSCACDKHIVHEMHAHIVVQQKCTHRNSTL